MIATNDALDLPHTVAQIFREGELQPRMHPNGFIQLDLMLDPESRIANRRLHVWPDNSDDFPRQKVRTSIHDHKFDMSSEILVGELRQVTFNFSLEWEMLEGPTHQIYVARYSERHSSTLEPSGAVCRLASMSEEVYEPGEIYEQDAATFHDTEIPDGVLTATLMTKVKEYEFHQPRVMVPIGFTPDNDFRRDEVDVDLLWDKIDEAMEALLERIAG